MMKMNKWTLGLAAVGLVSIPSVMQAEEKLSPLTTALSSTVISGYISTSMHYNPGTGNSAPPAYAFNGPTKQDGFNVNVVDITLEKPLSEGTWSAGYKVELWIGPDAVGFNAATAAAGGDLTIKQAYVSLRVPVGNGLDLKIGTFDTIIGYEVANAGSNPNYTRSYGYTMEPTEHTGILASYQINKMIGITAGVANSWNSGLSTRAATAGGHVNEGSKTYMGAVTLTAPDSFGAMAGSALYLGVVSGQNTAIAGGVNITSYYVGATLNTPIKGMKVGASYDYGHAPIQDLTGFARGVNAEALAIYTSYQATEKLSLHARGEYFRTSPFIAAVAPAGTPSEVIAFTGTVQYDLWANVLSRLEVRWDHSTAGSAGLNKPFNASDKNAFLIAANIIYKF